MQGSSIMKLFGREKELEKLNQLKEKQKASFVVMMGRRRIGKSTLVKCFAEPYNRKFLFEGLPPHSKQTNIHQLEYFAKKLSEQSGIPGLAFNDWSDAFAALAKIVSKGQTVVLLDEISWMGNHDPDFSGKLKIAWDNFFSQNDKLIFIICGSVSSWIHNNILNSAHFLGRVSLQMNLKELPLSSIANFTGKTKVQAIEMIRYLCIVGSIPKYLEEIRYGSTADEEIQRLCFTEEGFLFNEFDKIFKDIFFKRSDTFKKIVSTLLKTKLSATEIAHALGQQMSGELSEDLNILVLSGFLARDYVYNADGKKSKKNTYRIKDNYLRFYLKYIGPSSEKIKMSEEFSGWDIVRKKIDSIFGLQFENLVLNHLAEVVKGLGISFSQIKTASPYYQNKTKKNHGACQIDLLIQCENDIWYLCEIKFRRKITSDIIDEIKNKMEIVDRPKKVLLRTALIYYGEIDEDTLAFFDKSLAFKNLLDYRSH